DGVIQKWGVSKGLNKALSVAKALEDGSLTGVAAVQQALSVQEGDDRFEFTEIVANMTLANGIANNTKFNLSAPLSDIQGAGQVDLVKQVIDYGLKLNLSKNKGNNENYIPIKITGPLTKPSYKIDTESLLKAKAGTEVKEKIKDKIGKELGDKVGGDILKALPF
ncbi:MAG: AsmA-like C-terminal region-containing protein, partial [Pseudomonadota bacterium]|nr:AsmA-like C-terminal region-containing protein [Pseudomonadota bacterium]